MTRVDTQHHDRFRSGVCGVAGIYERRPAISERRQHVDRVILKVSEYEKQT